MPFICPKDGTTVRRCLLTLTLLLAGCDEPAAPCDAPPPPPAVGTAFDAARSGSVRGVVRWDGTPPAVAAFESVADPIAFDPGRSAPLHPWPNPNAPRVAAGRLAGAFVWLEGVDPRRAKPTALPPVTVELKGRVLSPTRSVARAGDEVTFVSRDGFHHSLQGRGANHFSLTLPEANPGRARRIDAPGVVELRSGAGMYWMRGHVLVQPHPYMAVTDEQGGFAFDGVPDGEYRLIAWHPGWAVVGKERSPDTLRVCQVTFADGPRAERVVRVEAGRAADVAVGLGGGP